MKIDQEKNYYFIQSALDFLVEKYPGMFLGLINGEIKIAGDNEELVQQELETRYDMSSYGFIYTVPFSLARQEGLGEEYQDSFIDLAPPLSFAINLGVIQRQIDSWTKEHPNTYVALLDGKLLDFSFERDFTILEQKIRAHSRNEHIIICHLGP